MVKRYVVVAASVSGLGNRIFYEGDVVCESSWSPGKASELVSTGFLRLEDDVVEADASESAFMESPEVFEGFSTVEIYALIGAYKGGFIADPATEKIVPIEAVILDVDKEKAVPVSAVILDPEMEKIVPITAVLFDPSVHVFKADLLPGVNGSSFTGELSSVLPAGIDESLRAASDAKEYPPIDEMSKPEIIDEIEGIARRKGTVIDFDPRSSKPILYGIMICS